MTIGIRLCILDMSEILIPNMAVFALSFGFLAQEYNTMFADKHRHEARVTFDIASRGTYLCDSESFLKAIYRAKKSTHLVKMEQTTVHTELILKRSWHTSFLTWWCLL